MPEMTLRALARRLGVTHTAVVKATKTGRLARSLGRDARGRVVVVDAELAAVEFAQNAAAPRGLDDRESEDLVTEAIEFCLRAFPGAVTGRRGEWTEFDPGRLLKLLRADRADRAS